MITQHTPGPWEYSHSDAFAQHFDVWQTMTSRTLARTITSQPIEEQEANARLIAAAPELLAALQQAADVLFEVCTPDNLPLVAPALKAVRAAIAKATGGAVNAVHPIYGTAYTDTGV